MTKQSLFSVKSLNVTDCAFFDAAFRKEWNLKHETTLYAIQYLGYYFVWLYHSKDAAEEVIKRLAHDGIDEQKFCKSFTLQLNTCRVSTISRGDVRQTMSTVVNHQVNLINEEVDTDR